MDYLLTRTTYGTWLQGDPRQAVDRHHNVIGTPGIPPNPKLAAFERREMKETPWQFSGSAAARILAAIEGTCAIREWFLFAAHVRRQHIHVVPRAPVDGSLALNALKANGTRFLKPLYPGRQRIWTRSGSIRRLATEQARLGAVCYVAECQG